MFDSKLGGSRRQASVQFVRAMLGIVLVAAWIAAVPSAFAQPGGRGGHGMGPGMMMFQGSPERLGHVIDHMLDGLSATDAQRSQIKQIAQAAAADLKAERESGRALREQGLQVFTAPTVDAAAAESVRQQMLAQHDQGSRRMLQAMLDISRVLTAEQRAKLGERMKQRQAVMHERMQRMQRERPAR